MTMSVKRDETGAAHLCAAVVRMDQDGPVATASWRHELIGRPEDPVGQHLTHVAAGVHDPLPRHRGDVVVDPACELLGGRPCFWRPADDLAGPVIAFVSYGRDALEDALEALLEELE
jgi:hypothetical protein